MKRKVTKRRVAATRKVKPKTLFASAARLVKVIPGVKQDETGFTYRIGLLSDGGQERLPVTLPGRTGKEMWAKG